MTIVTRNLLELWGVAPDTCSTAAMTNEWVLWNQDYQTATTTTVWTDWNTQYINCQLLGSSQRQAAATQGANTAAAYNLQAAQNQYMNMRLDGLQAAGLGGGPPMTARESAVQNEYQQRLAVVAKLQVEALQRATELLVATLSPQQAAEFKSTQAFTVHSKTGDRIYRVTYGTAGNVYELSKEGRKVAKYCIHPSEDVPVPDVMLAQKLMLETDEKQFLKVANKTPLQVTATVTVAA